ncbi:hypothetical protein AURDEDRAFT_167682 [Auricularia subglabra TFB-10046 SS5]|nr:hypothetical protein AURDEDRAFT_167682 [Auricularia subglabra TFB-10046 SS5]
MYAPLPVFPGDIVLVYCSVNEPILREAWHLRGRVRMTPRMREDFDAIFERRNRGGKKRPCVVIDVDDDEVLIAPMATFEKRPVSNLPGLYQLFAVSVGRTPGHPFPRSAKLEVAPTWPPSEKEKATHYIISRPFRVDRDEVMSVWSGYHVSDDQLDDFEDVCEKAMELLHGLTNEQLQLLYDSYEERTTIAWKTKMRIEGAQRKIAKTFSLQRPAPTNLPFVDAIWAEEYRQADKPKAVSALVDTKGVTAKLPAAGKREQPAVPAKSAVVAALEQSRRTSTPASGQCPKLEDGEIDELADALDKAHIAAPARSTTVAEPERSCETRTPASKQRAASEHGEIDSLAIALEKTHIASPAKSGLTSLVDAGKASPATAGAKISIPLKSKLAPAVVPLAPVKLALFPIESEAERKTSSKVYAALGEAIRKGLENPSFARIKSSRSVIKAGVTQIDEIQVATAVPKARAA